MIKQEYEVCYHLLGNERFEVEYIMATSEQDAIAQMREGIAITSIKQKRRPHNDLPRLAQAHRDVEKFGR